MIEIKERVDIRDILLTDPERKAKPFFDPAEYIHPKDKDFARIIADDTSDPNWLTHLFQIRIAMPDEFQTIPKNITAINKTKVKIDVLSNNAVNWLKSQFMLAQALLAFPEERDILMEGNSRSKKLSGKANSARHNSWEHHIQTYSAIKVIDPELAQMVKIDHMSKSELQEITHRFPDFTDSLNIAEAAHARIIFPGNPEIWKPTAEEWDQMKNYFRSRKPDKKVYGEVLNFLKAISAATILGADDVRLTKENGVELIYGSTRENTVEPESLPQRRRF